MIDRAGVFDAERTGHGGTIAEKRLNGKKVDLTLRILVPISLAKWHVFLFYKSIKTKQV
jgi:hypothetical protein